MRMKRTRTMDGRVSRKKGGAAGKRKETEGRLGKRKKRTEKGVKTKHAERRTKRPRRSSRVGSLAALAKPEGCAMLVQIVERAGRERDEAKAVCEFRSSLRSAGRGATGPRGTRHKAAGRMPRISAETCGALAAVGHTQRATLLRKLLEGPATYRTLQRATKLKAGPLYHHVNHLRLAGLILPKQRDLYELTRGGRNLILAVMAVGGLIRDRRRRPQPEGI